MEHTDFAHRLALEVRAEAGRQNLSQTDLARRSGISRPTVHRYFFTEERDATIDAVVAIARALSLTASELMRRAESAGEPAVKRPVARRVAARSVAPQRRDG